MTPGAIIREAQAEGVRLAISDTGTLKATGDGAAVESWLPTIRRHKDALIAELQGAANDPAAAIDREAFDERAAILEFDGGLSRAEAEQRAAELFGLTIGPWTMAAKSCKTCTHAVRPGIGNLYCTGRDDLPRAYGANHPLRQLPPDHGESCRSGSNEAAQLETTNSIAEGIPE